MEKEIYKSCKNCYYKNGEICFLSGYHASVERMNPEKCGEKFENWIKKEPSLFRMIINKLFKI